MPFLDSDPSLVRKRDLMNAIVESFADYEKERALKILMMWLSTQELEEMAPTICGKQV